MLTILVVLGFSGSPLLIPFATEEACLAKKHQLKEFKYESFCLPVTADKESKGDR